MINKYVQVAVCMLAASGAAAQTEAPDSTQTRQLTEVVVSAPKVIRKSDMDMYIPSKSAVEVSQNGLQLLGNLMIPALSVNDVMGTVTSSGQSVQVRINGREATLQQVRELLPENIKRVEWLDNPGLKYNGAYAVVNFIVANPTLGGSLMLSAMPALNTAWGNYGTSLKLNNGHSQWGLSASGKVNNTDVHREYQETFTYPDGSRLVRTETPLGGKLKDNYANFQTDYSYIKPDTTVLWVSLSAHKEWSSGNRFDGLMSYSNDSREIRLSDMKDYNCITPSYSVYLEQHFGRDRVLAIDMSGSFNDGHSRHEYLEEDDATNAVITDVNTSIKDFNRAYGIEADYTRKWRKSRLTFGASYKANRNRSTYENMGGEIFRQRQDRAYFFGEYLYRLDKVTLTGGVGAQHTSFKFLDSDRGNGSWNVRPRFSAQWRYGQVSQWRFEFSTWQTAPTLTETNEAPLQIDGFQWQTGNQNLHTWSTYRLRLQYNYTLPRLSGSIRVEGRTSPDRIAPFYAWDGERLVRSFENSRGRQYLSGTLSTQVTVVPGWLDVAGSMLYHITRTRGTGYDLTERNLSGDVTAMLRHYGFQLTVQYRHGATTLVGESKITAERFSLVDLSYNWKDWMFSAGVMCPFTKYDQPQRLLNRYNSNEQHTRVDIAPMPFLRIGWNLQWGRQKRGVSKLVNADSSVDSSSAGGR